MSPWLCPDCHQWHATGDGEPCTRVAKVQEQRRVVARQTLAARGFSPFDIERLTALRDGYASRGMEDRPSCA